MVCYVGLLPLCCLGAHGAYLVKLSCAACEDCAERAELNPPSDAVESGCCTAPPVSEMERRQEELEKRRSEVDKLHTAATAALWQAAKKGQAALAREQLAAGADSNSAQRGGQTALHAASEGGHVEMVTLLLEKGARPGAKDKDGRTPLHLAAVGGHLEVVEKLVVKGADIHARSAAASQVPVHAAAGAGHGAVVAALLKAPGADIDVRDKALCTPLMEAARGGHLEALKILLDKGAALGAASAKGQTALDLAKKQGHLHVVHFFNE